MGQWAFEVLSPALVAQGLTQRDQFNNDEVGLAEALVREVIQNSTDATSGGPVKVRFALREFGARDAATLRGVFEGLRPHLSACHVDMEALDTASARLLIIEDFGTKGLTGDPGMHDDDNFDRFF